MADDLLEAEFFVEPLVELLHLDLQRLALERALDEEFEALDVDGLGEKVDRAAFHRLHGGFDVAVGGHHDDGGPAGQGERLVDDLEAGFSRHAQIGDDRVVRLRLHEVERLVGVGGDGHVVTLGERLLEAFARVLLVVDNEDTRDHGAAFTRPSPSRSSAGYGVRRRG